MTEPIVGKVEDFTVEVLTEVGAKIRHSALDHVAIDDDRLHTEARELPQVIFYYQAAYCRLNLRAAQAKIRLDQAEANAFVRLRSGSVKVGGKMPIEEIKARIVLDPVVQEAVSEQAEIQAKAEVVQGILSALRQKGYSLQLIASIRGKENDWLRNSFADRFANHPKRDQIAQAFNQIAGDTIL